MLTWFTKLCSRVKIWSLMLLPGRKLHLVSSNSGSTISHHSFFKALGIHVSSNANERGVPVVSVFHPFHFFVYKDDHDSLPNIWCFSRTPGNLTHTIHPTNSSIQRFEHFRLDCIAMRWLRSLLCLNEWDNVGCSDVIFLTNMHIVCGRFYESSLVQKYFIFFPSAKDDLLTSNHDSILSLTHLALFNRLLSKCRLDVKTLGWIDSGWNLVCVQKYFRIAIWTFSARRLHKQRIFGIFEAMSFSLFPCSIKIFQFLVQPLRFMFCHYSLHPIHSFRMPDQQVKAQLL